MAVWASSMTWSWYPNCSNKLMTFKKYMTVSWSTLQSPMDSISSALNKWLEEKEIFYKIYLLSCVTRLKELYPERGWNIIRVHAQSPFQNLTPKSASKVCPQNFYPGYIPRVYPKSSSPKFVPRVNSKSQPPGFTQVLIPGAKYWGQSAFQESSF